MLKGEPLARGRLAKEFLKDQSGPSSSILSTDNLTQKQR